MKLRELTDDVIAKASAGEKLNDGNGLLVLCKTSGRKVFVLRTQTTDATGKRRDTTTNIGDHKSSPGGTMTLAQARRAADELRVEKRKDPLSDKPTLLAAIEDWRDTLIKKGKADHAEDSYRLRVAVSLG